MHDFVELVKSLRLCAKYRNAENALANVETAADAIEEMLAAVPKGISLEEYRDSIIKTLQEHRMQMDESYNDSEFALGYAEAFKVVCMMPLPEPPKEDAE